MQHLLSIPQLDGSTKNHVNSIFCYIHQMAAPPLLQQCSSPNSKSMMHFIAQNPQVPAHKQSGQQSAHMHAEQLSLTHNQKVSDFNPSTASVLLYECEVFEAQLV
ncbi:hypothetical protein AVEN_2711-1 [Araneus ventricosus]|uniref:Uncharacterized protein n=1 Tax=Araneus ventricosus TaxID=182803 RepID=A0A4Y2X9X0_ARAVE|nr:hypothetical protein AVEN_2711-1 [Araneus ventricosus]